MNAQHIISGIAEIVGVRLDAWQIGITQDLLEREMHWRSTGRDVQFWTQWLADSLEDAQAIEAHFIKLGMKGGVGGDLSPWKPTYVYVF
jgi:hypothetical protein